MNCAVWWLLGAQVLWGVLLPWTAPVVPVYFSLLHFSPHMSILVKQGDIIAPILQTGSREDFPRPKWL